MKSAALYNLNLRFSLLFICVDEWVSTLHRVIIPKSFYQNATQNTIIERRQSIAYFCNLNGDAIVEPMGNNPPKYPPITAKEHLMAKHLASMSLHDEL